MRPNTLKIIGCQVVANELTAVMPNSLDCQVQVIEAGLHTRPGHLKAALQTAIDSCDGVRNPIMLGFGLCAQAVVGLVAAASTIIIPRTDDCIGILLGNNQAYKKQLKTEPGTYFLSPAWIDAGITLVDELKEMSLRYGVERAERIQKKMLNHYHRLAFLNMGDANQTRHRTIARKVAAQLGLVFDEIQGSRRLLRLMVTGPWDEADFITVPPGTPVALERYLIK